MSNLSIQNLHIHFSGVVALEDVSFDVTEGEIFSLIGPNGSGKSTLFNCINGFCSPQRGSIKYNNVDLLARRPHEIVKYGISRTFQNLQNVPFMTLLDNILLGAHRRLTVRDTFTRWISRKERGREEALALEVMDFLGIANFEKKSEELFRMRKLVDEAMEVLSSDTDIRVIGEMLHTTWEYKRSLSGKVSNPMIDDIYSRARQAGAVGGKLLGAGGGGFMLLLLNSLDLKPIMENIR